MEMFTSCVESTNNKNNKTTLYNVALESKTICLICKQPGHATEKCFHLSKVLNISELNELILELVFVDKQ